MAICSLGPCTVNKAALATVALRATWLSLHGQAIDLSPPVSQHPPEYGYYGDHSGDTSAPARRGPSLRAVIETYSVICLTPYCVRSILLRKKQYCALECCARLFVLLLLLIKSTNSLRSQGALNLTLQNTVLHSTVEEWDLLSPETFENHPHNTTYNRGSSTMHSGVQYLLSGPFYFQIE